MRKSILCLAFTLGLTSPAWADSGAPVTIAPMADAGVAEGSGSGSAAAVAAPAPQPLPDPVEHPVEAGSTLYKLYKSGGLIPTIIVGLFLLVTFLSRKVKWLQEDHRAVYVTAALGGLTLLIEPASRGATPNLAMILGAVGAAAALALNPKKPAVDAAKAEAAK